MKNLYRQLNNKSFFTIAFLIALCGDIILLSYIYIRFADIALFEQILAELWKVKQLLGEPDPGFVKELFQVWVRSLVIFLVIGAIAHLVLYIAWLKKGKYATGYVLLYFRIAMIGFPLMGLGMFSAKTLWALCFIAMGFGYFFVLGGIKKFESHSKN